MSKLNPAGSHPSINAATSQNGNIQHLKSDRQSLVELLSVVLFGKDDFYASTSQRTMQLSTVLTKMVSKNDFDFIANAIVYARSHMNIRVFPIVATVQFAKALRDQNKKYAKLRLMVSSVIQRADQITDMLNYAIGVFGSKKAVPAAIKRGIGDAFNSFNEYHFAKYNRDGQMKFSDALRIVHPSPKDEDQAILFDKIMNEARPENLRSANGFLQTPYTWEVELSANTQPKSAVWSALIKSEKLGYTALLKNLRNIESACSGETINMVGTTLTDPVRIAKARVLPFEIVQAHQHVTNSVIRQSLNSAMEYTLANVGFIAKKIWFLLDSSGSMQSSGVNNHRGQFVAADAAAILAAGILKSAALQPDNELEFHITTFDSVARTLKVNPSDSFMKIQQQIRNAMKGGSTNLEAGLREYSKLGFVPDLIVVISDMQVDRMETRRVTDIPGTKIALNVTADNSTPLSELIGWKQISGLSSNTLAFIKQAVNGENYMRAFDQPFVGKQPLIGTE